MTNKELRTAKWALRLPKTKLELKRLIARYKRFRKENTFVQKDERNPIKNDVITSILRAIRKYDYERILRDKTILSDSMIDLNSYLNDY